MVEEQVYQVPADHAGAHRPDREIPYRRLIQSPAACPPDEQRRREPDACRRENTEGLDGEWPDLQRRDDEIGDQSTTRTEAATTTVRGLSPFAVLGPGASSAETMRAVMW